MTLASGLKKISYFFAFIAILIIAAVVAVVFVVDKDAIKKQVITQVEKATGRKLAVSGDISINFWPSIGVSVSDVTLSNADWAKEKYMLEVKSLDVDLAVKPLINKEVIVNKFVLNSPKVVLEVSSSGKQNWVFDMPVKEEKAKGASQEVAVTDKQSPATELSSFSIEEFSIKNAQLIYIDHAANKREAITDFNTDIMMTSLTEAISLQGDLKYNNLPLAFDLKLDNVMSMMDTNKAKLEAKLNIKDTSILYNGSINTAASEMVVGDLDARIKDVNALLNLLDVKGANAPVNNVSLKGQVAAGSEHVKLSSLQLNVDDIEARGNITANIKGKPAINADVQTNVIVLDKFLTAESKSENIAPKATTTKTKSQGWSTETIDLSALKTVDVLAKLKTGGVVYKDLQTGPTVLQVTLQNGLLNTKLSETRLAGGQISMSSTVDARTAKPSFVLKTDLLGVQAKPVLTKLAGFKDLSGKAFVTIDVTTSGSNQKQMVSALNGSGKAIFKDGAIEGIDAVNMAQNIQGKMTEFGFYSEGRTEFVSTGGSYTIKNGLLSNQDFAMEGPLVEAQGKGTVNLPKQYLNYRVTPELVLSQSSESKTGLVVPVDIKGHWSNPKIKPDFKSVIAETINNPEKLEGSLKQMKEQFKGVEDKLKENPDQAKELLKGILGGF